MGCNTSKALSEELDDITEKTATDAQLRATILIQQWFRRWRAELEIRRRYTWTIFQTMEYANENEQLQLYNFFNEIISGLPDAFNALQMKKSEPEGSRAEFFSRLSNPEFVTIEAGYDGPTLTLPLTLQQITDLIEAFKEKKVLHAKYVLVLLGETRKQLKLVENVQRVSTQITGKVTVVGDLHGSLDDLLMIFFKNGLPSSDNPYIFNGDFVDRGPHSVEVSVILFALKLLYPNTFFINRGNHEDVIMNKRYGFTTEIVNKYGVLANRIAKSFEGVFRVIPLVTIIDSSVLVCHGGVSDITDIEYINNIPREKYASILRPPVKSGETEIDLVEWRQMLDLLWSDPKPGLGCEPNTFRGGGTYFGPDITDFILEKHKFKLLIRSHECKVDGYEQVHEGKVVTVFSASNYYDEGSNLGAYVKIGTNHKPQFVQFTASEKTTKLPLYTKVSMIESSALRDLRTTLFANHGALQAAFEKLDTAKAGLITKAEWANCMRTVLKLDLPWLTLRSKLVDTDENGKIRYSSCFENGELKGDIDNKRLTEEIYRQRNTLETIFRILDTDNSGCITKEELRAGCELLAKHNQSVSLSSEELEQLVDTMDIDGNGEINFNEFLESFRLVDSKFGPEKN